MLKIFCPFCGSVLESNFDFSIILRYLYWQPKCLDLLKWVSLVNLDFKNHLPFFYLELVFRSNTHFIRETALECTVLVEYLTVHYQ